VRRKRANQKNKDRAWGQRQEELRPLKPKLAFNEKTQKWEWQGPPDSPLAA
jgi:hypothetical protein